MSRKDFVLGGLILASTVLLTLLKQLDVEMVFAPVAVIVYALVILFFLRGSGPAALLLMPFAILKGSELISVVLIEFGAKMTEVGMTGRDIGASTGLLVHDILFFGGAMLVARRRKALLKATSGPVFSVTQSQIAFFIAAALCLIGVVAGVLYGFSLFSGVDRFSFRVSSGNGLLGFFLSNRLVAIFIFGILAAADKKWMRHGACLGIVMLIVTNILHGEQLMSTVSLIVSFFCIRTITKGDDRGFIKNMMIVAALATLFGLMAFALSYASQKKDVLTSVAARAVLQGQLWYAVVEDRPDSNEMAYASITRNIEALGAVSVDDYVNSWPPIGVRELMYKYSDTSLYNSYTENGVTFTMGTSGYLYYLFGYWGSLIAEFMLGLFAGLGVTLIAAAMVRPGVVLWVVSAKLYALLVLGLQQGDFWYLFGVRTIVTGLVLWLCVSLSGKGRRVTALGYVDRTVFQQHSGVKRHAGISNE